MKLHVLPAATVSASALPGEIEDLPLPYLELDAEGTVLRANRAARAMHHPGNGELVGSRGWDVIALDQKHDYYAAFKAIFASGEDPAPVMRSIFDRSGKFRSYQLHRNLIRDAHGAPTGMRVVLVDITEHSRSMEEMRQENHWLGSAVASITEAIILTDVLGAIRTVNPAAQKMAGTCAKQLAGMPIEEAFPLVQHKSANGGAPDHRTTLERPWKGTGTILNRSGDEVDVEISSAPILDHTSGVACGVVAILREIDRDG